MLIDIKDEIYPVLSENERIRKTVRAFLVNEKKEVYLLHIQGKDQFGMRDHYETPGGGVEEDESDTDALKREILEETGYTIKNIKYVGEAQIEYHLLKRFDHASFYICYTDKLKEKHLLDYEKELFKESKWIPLSDVLNFYENLHPKTVGAMIHQRDYTVLKYAIEKNMFEV